MKRIFMLVNYTPSDKSIGITKKISAQIKSLRALGHSVVYSSYEKDGIAIYGEEDQILYFRKYSFNNKKLRGLYRYFDLLTAATNFVEEAELPFDICYARINAMNRKYLKLLSIFKSRNTKIIVEALSYFPGVKMKTIKGKYVAWCLKHNRKKIQKIVDMFLTEGSVESFYGIKHKPAKMGVETDELPKHVYTGPLDELNLISVANERIYHGYDRLIKSLAEYKANGGNKKVRIHLVGVMSDKTLSTVRDLSLQDDVVCYGKQYGDKLYAIYEQCNLGIGPLAQHRIGGKKDTGLKTKEYFGMGLPYFYAGEEPDLPENYPYVFEVPSDESMIDFESIWDFYVRLRSDESVASNMRDFARKTFSWEAIMQEALKIE